jgi:hypothetical protein
MMPLQQPQQPAPIADQQQRQKRKGPSPWLLGAAALGGGYLGDRFGNSGKGMQWLKDRFQQAVTPTPKPVVPDAIEGLQQRSDAMMGNYGATMKQLHPASMTGQTAANTATMTAATGALSPLANQAVGWAGKHLPGRLGSTLVNATGKAAPHLNKIAPVASKALMVAAPISSAYNAANSDAFNGSAGGRTLGAALGATKGALQATGIPGMLTIPLDMTIDSGLNAYRSNVALQSADQGAADVQMRLMKHYLTALKDPATQPAALESAKRYFNPTMQQSLNDPAQQERYGHNAWLWDKIKPMLGN